MGVEVTQVVKALAHPDFDDGQLKLVADGKRDAALGRAVELRDDKRVQLELAVELARLLQAVLTGGGVDDEHGVDRQLRALAHHVDHLRQLAHEVCRGVQATGGVDEHQVGIFGLGALDGVVAHACRIGAALARDHLHVGALRPHLELLDGGGAERVGAAQDDLAASVVRFLGKLAHRGGLARAVDADEQHARRVAAEDLLAAFGEGVGNLVVEHVEHGIGVGKRLARGLVAQVLHDVACRRSADVSQDERFLQAVPELLIKVGTAVEEDVHLLLELVARTLQPLADAVEKSHVAPLVSQTIA